MSEDHGSYGSVKGRYFRVPSGEGDRLRAIAEMRADARVSAVLDWFADHALGVHHDGKARLFHSRNAQVEDLFREMEHQFQLRSYLWHVVRDLLARGRATFSVGRFVGALDLSAAGDSNFIRWSDLAGCSLLLPCAPLFRQLVLVESAITVCRLRRAPVRTVFRVDVGGSTAKNPSVTLVGDLARQLLSSDEDFLVPVSGDYLGGEEPLADSARNVEDELFEALHCPRSLLGAGLFSDDVLARKHWPTWMVVADVRRVLVRTLHDLGEARLTDAGLDAHGWDVLIPAEDLSGEEEAVA